MPSLIGFPASSILADGLGLEGNSSKVYSINKLMLNQNTILDFEVNIILDPMGRINNKK